ncbi:AraC family transcriptional regulator [Dysgonomonas sp. ZJ709]|uniref:AraC family transcriptional regulator n=1 Tax=Dysgonomonas sp. ZJ709 TaxID=2709797 RepID=UPI0013EC4F3B|nr:AraC family transcriptional regulator [Dysgonomonas sp. ZJ709]
MTQIKHGFHGQWSIILPFFIVEEMDKNYMMNDLYFHSLGYFPSAKYHYISRPSGCPENILIYCTKGSGWFEFNGKVHGVKENQYIILPACIAHRYGANNSDPWTIFWIHFKGYKSDLFKNEFGKIISIDPENNSRIDERLKLFEEIYNVLSVSHDNNALQYANFGLSYFLGSLLYVKTHRSSKSEDKYGTSLIHLATHYMNENIGNKLKLADIANYFGYSTSYFYRLFYKNMGIPPMEYFNQLKIQRSCYHLLSSTMKVNQISMRVGFEDPYYYSRLFKKTMGISPARYRVLNKLSDKFTGE